MNRCQRRRRGHSIVGGVGGAPFGCLFVTADTGSVVTPLLVDKSSRIWVVESALNVLVDADLSY